MPDPTRSAPRNILHDDGTAGPPAVTHSTEAVVALLARACRATCGEVGDDDKAAGARLVFTTSILALRELDPRTDTIVRRLAQDCGSNPDMIPLSRAIMPRD